MKINSNSTAVITGNYLLRAENSLSKSSQRLSSGYKINNASDSPAGYAISSKMRAQIKALEKANDNAETASDFINTADGALQEVHSVVQRMNELAVKSANATNTSADREAIQQEMDQLKAEIERISEQTDFNDQTILDGNYEYRGYTDTTSVKVLSYSDDTIAGNYDISLSVSSTVMTDADGNTIYDEDGNEKREYTLDSADLSSLPNGATAEIKEGTNIVTITNSFGMEINLSIEEDSFSGDVKLDLNKVGAMRIQIGDKEGQTLEMSIPEISLKKMGLEDLDVTTEEGADRAIEQIQNALDYTSAVRSKLGAYQNRLEHVTNSLDVTSESLENSYSTLTDTDMASEMTEYTRLQVLQQAATSMLAQANEFPQQALQLLQ